MGSADPLTVTALVVAFVALFTTFIQVLQQFFATAEGYRRCLPGVMGPWAQRTHKRWRWGEFRYETLYTAPEFYLNQAQRGRDFVEIRGNEPSRKETWTPPRSDDLRSTELVCWIPFLQALHEESASHGTHNSNSLPAVRHHERSWDFMPPDVVRPLASSNISDMCILVRRLGLIWKDCRPYEGGMRAEGSGHVITSTMMRGVGLVLDYTYLGAELKNPPGNYIWKLEADKMGFGILPGNTKFSIPDFVIGTKDDILARLSEFDRTDKARNKVKEYLDISSWSVAFCDLIPLAAPMLRIRGSTTIRIPSPTSYNTGLTKHYEGFKAFHYQLREMVDRDTICDRNQDFWTSTQYQELRARYGQAIEKRIWVLEQYDKLLEKHGEVWANDLHVESRAGHRTNAFLDDVQACYDETTEYFIFLESQRSNRASKFCYLDLVKAHVTQAVFYYADGQLLLRAGQARPHFHFNDASAAEGMHIYFEYIPKYVQSMKEAGCDDEELVKDAWVMLMFRAFCWHRCHLMVDGLTVPSQYYGSQQSIYIG